jgi:arylsulfatase A-like enzyme
MMGRFRIGAILCSICLMVGANSLAALKKGANGKPMNVLFFIVDDLGCKDIVANRNPATDGPTIYETPAMDQLAADGMRFRQAYANGPRCVVSRISMMTGNYHFRPNPKESAPRFGDHQCFSEVLQKAGYHTGYLGKWHLGYSEEDGTRPVDRGFDFNVGSSKMGSPGQKGGYFAPYNTSYIKGLEDAPEGEYITERLTEEAIGFLQDHAKKKADEPFLLCVAHYAVHMPIEAKPEDIAYFEKKRATVDFGKQPERRKYYTASEKMRQDNATYAAMVKGVDDSLAALRAELDRLDMADNTVIILTSDHGGKSCTSVDKDGAGQPTSNYPLRTGKGWLYEGGVRIPMFVSWPGVVQPGAVTDSLVLGSDLYNTILAAAQIDPISGEGLDSVSFAPTVADASVSNRDAVHFNFTTQTGNANTPMSAFRKGDYKYVLRLIENKQQLFNIATDESESNDLVEQMPELASSMNKELFEFLDSIGIKPYNPGKGGKKYDGFVELLQKAGVDY